MSTCACIHTCIWIFAYVYVYTHTHVPFRAQNNSGRTQVIRHAGCFQKEKGWRASFYPHSSVPSHRITQPNTKSSSTERRRTASLFLGPYSPGRVGGRYEEVDDHAVDHVQAVLHHPGAEKVTLQPRRPWDTRFPTAREGPGPG